jgi:hypothetical protein
MRTRCGVALLLALLLSAAPARADESEEEHWWSGFSFTPGVGSRALVLDMVRSDGWEANIANTGTDSLFWSFNIETPTYHFGESNFGVSILAHASNFNLEKQWVVDASGAGSRERIGTAVSGYYK